MSKKLVFIYNADSWLGNAVSDSIHKFVSPETYQCDLCALTHGFFWAKKQWNSFLQSITIPVEFYHKNEINKLHYTIPSLPCVLIVDEQKIIRSLAWDERKNINSLDELIKTITLHIKSFNLSV